MSWLQKMMNWLQKIRFALAFSARGYTDRAVNALISARQNAIKQNVNVINTDHILLGVASVGCGAAQLCLLRLGIDLSQQTREIAALAANNKEQSLGKILGFSHEALQLLNRAEALAINWGQKYVGTEHLLAGLLFGTPSSAGFYYLCERGIFFSDFQHELEKIYKEYKQKNAKGTS